MSFDTIEDILRFAIGKEEEAAAMYTDLAHSARRGGMRDVFLEFAEGEKRHKVRLERILEGGIPIAGSARVRDLGIAEQVVEVEPSPNMTYRDALLLAMKAEKAAYKLYTDLAAMTSDASLAEVFQSLAQEEARHKLRFEIEYDEQILEGT